MTPYALPLMILPASPASQLARSGRGRHFVSFVTNLPTSATVVMINLLLFGCSFLARRLLNPKSSN